MNAEFGTENDFRLLVDEAHQLGMKVIIDWVSNHTGCDHEWTLAHPSYYKKNDQGDFFDAHGWDDVIDLDYSNAQMRLDMIDAMHTWLKRFDLDGFRCDMAMLTPVDFWAEARASLEKQKKLFWIAELDPLDHPSYMEVFDSAYTWRWMNAAKDFSNDGSHQIHHLREVLFLYQQTHPSSSSPAWFTSNHDENSWNGTEYEKYGEMAVPLAVFSSTWKGLPLLYNGQEIPNHKRLSFFEKDPLTWPDKPLLQDFYKSLFELRKKYDAFINSDEPNNCSVVYNSVDHHVLSFRRSFNGVVVLVIINFSQYPLTAVQVDHGDMRGRYVEWFSSSSKVMNEDAQYVDLPAWGFQVWGE